MDYSSKCKSHPWHGINPGSAEEVRAFIEIVPTDTVKYEVDKETAKNDLGEFLQQLRDAEII